MKFQELTAVSRTVQKEIRDALAGVSGDGFTALVDAIEAAPRVFVTGQGRSGLMARTFAMRMHQIGVNCHIVGDTMCPPIGRGDVLIACSASGQTRQTLNVARQAKKHGAAVIAITSGSGAPLERAAALTVLVPARFEGPKQLASVQFATTLFEQTLFILFECAVLALAERLGADNECMMRRHANLE